MRTSSEIMNDVLVAVYLEGVPWVNAKLITAQAMVESADFTSNVFKQNNNIGGMKMPSVRQSKYIIGPGTSAPASEGTTPYAKYASPEDSGRDMVALFKYNHVDWDAIKTPMDWATWLKSKGYFGSSISSYATGIAAKLPKMDGIIEPVVVKAKKKVRAWLKFAIPAVVVVLSLILASRKNKRSKKRRYYAVH